jgi:hypothetical protein
MQDDIKVITSPTYGDVIWRKIGIISISTFNADNKEEFELFEKIHPSKHFSSLSIAKMELDIFGLWLPLEYDNSSWVYSGRTDQYRNLKKGELPIAVASSQVVKWFAKAEQFMSEVNDELIDLLYDDVEAKQKLDYEKPKKEPYRK